MFNTSLNVTMKQSKLLWKKIFLGHHLSCKLWMFHSLVSFLGVFSVLIDTKTTNQIYKEQRGIFLFLWQFKFYTFCFFIIWYRFLVKQFYSSLDFLKMIGNQNCSFFPKKTISFPKTDFKKKKEKVYNLSIISYFILTWKTSSTSNSRFHQLWHFTPPPFFARLQDWIYWLVPEAPQKGNSNKIKNFCMCYTLVSICVWPPP